MKNQYNSQMDEYAMVNAATKGDLEMFNQLVMTCQDLAYQHAYSLLNDPDTAQDVTQESFIKAFHALKSFRGGSFRSWLLRIVTNSAYDQIRRSQRHPTQPLFPTDDDGEELDSAPWLADPDASVQEKVENKELSNEVRILLDQLPETYRNVIILVDLYQFDYTEAAATLQVPVGTIKSRLARARLQMKEKLLNNGIFKSITEKSDLLMTT